ncbi:MAG TPA: hypothetical protein VNG71_15485 [Pyrinomonadaceae bacterium]|nr:hypothetical protein [Pyrinomonadaceae bacterium]
MSIDDDDLNDDSTGYERFNPLVSYGFDPRAYDFDTSNELTEDDDTLATELKRFYPELLNWPNRALATAWRNYSQRVGFVTEEFVCVREPNFLAFLYVNQETWPIDEERWIEILDRALNELWK